MGKVVLTPSVEAEFWSFQSPMEVLDAKGKPIGLYLPLDSCKKLLTNLQIPYSHDELDRRRQETGGLSLQEFWKTVRQS